MSPEPLEQIDKAQLIEALSAELYRLMASRLDADDACRSVLLRLAGEEDQHAQRLTALRERYLAAPESFGDDFGVLSDADCLIEEAQTLKRLLSAPDSSFTLDEARRFMIEQERRFSVAHAHALSAANPTVASLFIELARADALHLRVLEQLHLG